MWLYVIFKSFKFFEILGFWHPTKYNLPTLADQEDRNWETEKPPCALKDYASLHLSLVGARYKNVSSHLNQSLHKWKCKHLACCHGQPLLLNHLFSHDTLDVSCWQTYLSKIIHHLLPSYQHFPMHWPSLQNITKQINLLWLDIKQYRLVLKWKSTNPESGLKVTNQARKIKVCLACISCFTAIGEWSKKLLETNILQ